MGEITLKAISFGEEVAGRRICEAQFIVAANGQMPLDTELAISVGFYAAKDGNPVTEAHQALAHLMYSAAERCAKWA